MQHALVENYRNFQSLEWRQTRRRDRYDATCWDGDIEIGRVRMLLDGTRTIWHWTMTVERSDLVASSNGMTSTRDAACRALSEAYRRVVS